MVERVSEITRYDWIGNGIFVAKNGDYVLHQIHKLHVKRLEAELLAARERIAELEQRYAYQENQLLCLGYEGGCDGDLTALPHNDDCPAKVMDLKQNPHLYARQPAKGDSDETTV
jgi:hypothetical protein